MMYACKKRVKKKTKEEGWKLEVALRGEKKIIKEASSITKRTLQSGEAARMAASWRQLLGMGDCSLLELARREARILEVCMANRRGIGPLLKAPFSAKGKCTLELSQTGMSGPCSQRVVPWPSVRATMVKQVWKRWWLSHVSPEVGEVFQGISSRRRYAV